MDGTVTVVAVTAVSVIFVALQARYTRQQRVLNGVQLLGQLTGIWETLRPDWQLAVLLGRGVDDYYVDTPPSEVQAFVAFQRRVRLLERLESAANTLGHRAWRVMYDFNRSRTHFRRRHYEFRVRRVLVFLSTVGDLVVDGSLTPALAYGVLGTDLIRSGGALDSLMRTAPPDDPVGRGYAGHWAGWLDYYPGVERRLLVLRDVLWAEAVRRGDLTDDEAEAVAQHKAAHGTGLACRSRAGRLARRSGGPLIELRLRRLLRWAEVPPGGGGLARRLARLPGLSRVRAPGAPRRGPVRVRLHSYGTTIDIINRTRQTLAVDACIIVPAGSVPRYPITSLSYPLGAVGSAHRGVIELQPRSTATLTPTLNDAASLTDLERFMEAPSRVALVEVAGGVIRSRRKRPPSAGWSGSPPPPIDDFEMC